MADEVVRITIELDTEAREEIKQIAAALDKADKRLHSIKTDRVGKRIFESEQGAPIKFDVPEGPIFRGEEEPEEISRIRRPGRKSQPVQRQDAFGNLNKRLEDVEEESGSLKDAFYGGALVLGKGSSQNFIWQQIQKLIPFIGEALIAWGIVDHFMTEFLKDGGWFDRRFKLIIQRLVYTAISREKAATIRQRFQDVRMSSWLGPRGARRGQIFTTLAGDNRGFMYDEKLEHMTKGQYGFQ